MKGFGQGFGRTAAWIEQRSLRERALLLASLLGVFLVLWHTLLMDPVRKEQQGLAAGIKETETIIALVEERVRETTVGRQTDPDQENRLRLQSLQREIGQIETKLHEVTLDLIPPDKMPALLGEVLKKNPGLKLVKLENYPPVPLIRSADADGKMEANLFRHSMRLELEGTYLETLRYLQALEILSPRLFWEDIAIKVTRHPVASITITVYTLSLHEEWIGV